MNTNKKSTKKRSLKQWIIRYIVVLFIIGSLATILITGANSAYRKSVSSIDSARVAKWSFTFNGKNIAEIQSEPVDLLQNSYYGDVSQFVENEENKYNAVLVPGMSGSLTYQVKNDSEVAASLAKLSVKFQYLIEKPTAEMYTWSNDDWITWVDKMPIEWVVTFINGSDASSNLIKTGIDSKLHSLVAYEHLDNSILVHITWDIITDIHSELDYEINDEYKIMQLYWNWPYDRQIANMFYDETQTSSTVTKSLTYNQFISLPGKNLSVEPSFTFYSDEVDSIVTKTFTEMSFHNYLELFSYCKDTLNDYSMLYKYFNYKEYMKWKLYFVVPDDYKTEINDYSTRQDDYLTEIDTNFSNLDLNISAIISLTFVQKEPV